MKIIDTHAHLDHLDDIEQAMDNARACGVKAIMAMSMDLESCKKTLELKQKITDPKIFIGMGVHPSEADESTLDACVDLARQSAGELTVIGEIGLDFWYKWVRKDQQKKDEQRKVYRQFLQLAKELDLPAVIHSRGCWRECFEMAKSEGLKKAEFHWYSGPLDVLKDIIDEGYYISTTPSVAYSRESQAAVLNAPIEQTLIETDCPVFFREETLQGDEKINHGPGFKSEPKDVLKTLKAYCALKDVDEKHACEIFNNNARMFYDIDF